MLIQVQNVALSGMMAQTQRVANTAHNIANVGTAASYGKHAVEPNATSVAVSLDTRLSTLPHGNGVQAETLPRSPSTLPAMQSSHTQATAEGLISLESTSWPNTNLVEEQVTALSATRAYEANARVLRVADRLLDMTIQSLPAAGREKDER